MKHVATSRIVETTPEGILGEIYRCSCGSESTAAECAGTPSARAVSALFGRRPICPAIRGLHASGEDRFECDN